MDKTNFDELSTFVLDDEKYLKGEFVNKVLEYSKDMLLCTVWDTKKYQIISRKDKQVIQTIKHPLGDFRCWGINLVRTSMMISRDDKGLIMMDLSQETPEPVVVHQSTINTNLFGHGNILHVRMITDHEYAISTLFIKDKKEKSFNIQTIKIDFKK